MLVVLGKSNSSLVKILNALNVIFCSSIVCQAAQASIIISSW